MLVTLKEILEIAEEKKIAIGSFNAPSLESAEAIIEASEELDLPVIIQCAECHESLIRLSLIGPILIEMAKRTKTKICIHLDHGETISYLEEALKIGFTGLMYDGSTLSYEENVKNTKTVVEMAHKYGASVEAELGSMGRRESGSGERSGDEDETKIYTDPVLASSFVESTGIDALACSFGTTHGIYLKKPRLDFNVVKEVREKTKGIPVVMHGGSGVSKEDYIKAIESGVRKINYFTYMDKAGGKAAEEYIKSKNGSVAFFSDITVLARKAMKENVKEAMSTFARMDRV